MTTTNTKHLDFAKQMQMKTLAYRAKSIHLQTDVSLFSQSILLTSKQMSSAFLTNHNHNSSYILPTHVG